MSGSASGPAAYAAGPDGPQLEQVPQPIPLPNYMQMPPAPHSQSDGSGSGSVASPSQTQHMQPMEPHDQHAHGQLHAQAAQAMQVDSAPMRGTGSDPSLGLARQGEPGGLHGLGHAQQQLQQPSPPSQQQQQQQQPISQEPQPDPQPPLQAQQQQQQKQPGASSVPMFSVQNQQASSQYGGQAPYPYPSGVPMGFSQSYFSPSPCYPGPAQGFCGPMQMQYAPVQFLGRYPVQQSPSNQAPGYAYGAPEGPDGYPAPGPQEQGLGYGPQQGPASRPGSGTGAGPAGQQQEPGQGQGQPQQGFAYPRLFGPQQGFWPQPQQYWGPMPGWGPPPPGYGPIMSPAFGPMQGYGFGYPGQFWQGPPGPGPMGFPGPMAPLQGPPPGPCEFQPFQSPWGQASPPAAPGGQGQWQPLQLPAPGGPCGPEDDVDAPAAAAGSQLLGPASSRPADRQLQLAIGAATEPPRGPRRSSSTLANAKALQPLGAPPGGTGADAALPSERELFLHRRCLPFVVVVRVASLSETLKKAWSPEAGGAWVNRGYAFLSCDSGIMDLKKTFLEQLGPCFGLEPDDPLVRSMVEDFRADEVRKLVCKFRRAVALRLSGEGSDPGATDADAAPRSTAGRPAPRTWHANGTKGLDALSVWRWTGAKLMEYSADLDSWGWKEVMEEINNDDILQAEAVGLKRGNQLPYNILKTLGLPPPPATLQAPATAAKKASGPLKKRLRSASATSQRKDESDSEAESQQTSSSEEEGSASEGDGALEVDSDGAGRAGAKAEGPAPPPPVPGRKRGRPPKASIAARTRSSHKKGGGGGEGGGPARASAPGPPRCSRRPPPLPRTARAPRLQLCSDESESEGEGARAKKKEGGGRRLSTLFGASPSAGPVGTGTQIRIGWRKCKYNWAPVLNAIHTVLLEAEERRRDEQPDGAPASLRFIDLYRDEARPRAAASPGPAAPRDRALAHAQRVGSALEDCNVSKKSLERRLYKVHRRGDATSFVYKVPAPPRPAP
eukprot:tig00000383_g24631.t1